MKKLFAIAILGSVMLVSCKKSSSGGGLAQGTVNATIDGKASSFSAVVVALSSDSGKTIQITAADGTSNPNTFVITVNSDKAIVTGTYTDSTLIQNDFGETTPAQFSYLTSTGTEYDNAEVIGSPFVVKITSVSSTQIQGTFQGSVYLNQDPTQTKKVITGGAFNAKITATP
jgi:hypothetical protein